MRLQSHIWVSAFIRKEQGDGAWAAPIRKGSPEAGTIFISCNHLDGNWSLYAPLPQALATGDEGIGRRFECVIDHGKEEAVKLYLEKQMRFDSDCWIIETERREGIPSFMGD
ncbi:MAG: DUF1491 family protein [Nitratireductor sp.]